MIAQFEWSQATIFDCIQMAQLGRPWLRYADRKKIPNKKIMKSFQSFGHFGLDIRMLLLVLRNL